MAEGGGALAAPGLASHAMAEGQSPFTRLTGLGAGSARKPFSEFSPGALDAPALEHEPQCGRFPVAAERISTGGQPASLPSGGGGSGLPVKAARRHVLIDARVKGKSIFFTAQIHEKKIRK
jgi:hypothetical protein